MSRSERSTSYTLILPGEIKPRPNDYGFCLLRDLQNYVAQIRVYLADTRFQPGPEVAFLAKGRADDHAMSSVSGEELVAAIDLL